MAIYGTLPGTGPQLIDGTFVNGLAGGLNRACVSGLTAAGTNQATGLTMPDGYALYEFDTVGSGTGACLPFAFAGRDFKVYNNGANTLTLYPSVANNPITAAQDTILNTTSKTAATHVSTVFYCAKDGVWAAQ